MTARTPRILWIGDNPALPTLSAESSRKTCRALAKAGCEVFYYGLYRQLPPSVWEGITLLPALIFTGEPAAAAGLGGEIGLAHLLATVHPDVVITCGRPEQFEALRSLRRSGHFAPPVPWWHWPATDAPIASDDALLSDVENALVRAAPHPVETVFRPLVDRSACRARILAGDRFVVGSTARNVLRRGLAPVLSALAAGFGDLERYMLLWVEDLHRRELEPFRLVLGAAGGMRHHRAYWTDTSEDASAIVFDLLNDHYNAMDAYLSFAPAGGVDLGALEAQCAGTPVVRLADPDWLERLEALREAAAGRDRHAAGAAALAEVGMAAAAEPWLAWIRDLPVPAPRPAGVRINWYCTLFGSGSVNHCSREQILALDRMGADVTVEEPFPRFENPALFPDGFEQDYAAANPEAYEALRRIAAKRPHDADYTTVRFIVSRAEHGAYQLMRSLKAPVVEYTNNDNPGRLNADFLRPYSEPGPGGGPPARRLWAVSEYIKQLYGAAASFPAEMATGVDIVYHGVDPTLFNPWVEPAKLPTAGKFTFLNCSFPRVQHKGLDVLCLAFAHEFAGDPEVALVLKLPNRNKVVAPQEYAEVAKVLESARAVAGCPEIVVVEEDTPGRGDMAAYYAAAQAYVHPSRWEACSISLLECLAVGLPLIVTRWGGHREWCPEDMAYYVDCRPLMNDFGRAAEPVPESLRRQMRHVYEHRDEARERGARASAHIRENYTWDAAALRMIALLGGTPVRPGQLAST
ncbi:MAG: glycosyltransferase [Candidatus Sericytochromatia bacterium]|nr:glycosyltransferase [Candidatus Tanganyikabacteria bacterium]